jgi:uncharacterized protein
MTPQQCSLPVLGHRRQAVIAACALPISACVASTPRAGRDQTAIAASWRIAAAVTIILVLALSGGAVAAPHHGAGAEQTAVNRGVVEVETGRASGTSVQIAEDLADIVDDGATRRVLPVVGKGGLQNITDLDLLRGIDLAIIQEDALTLAREQHPTPGLDHITYIARLYHEELHLLARSDVKTVGDLANRKVNVDLLGGGTEVTAMQAFRLLNIPIVAVNDDVATALEKLRRGEIAAVALVAGKPAPILRDLVGEAALHFVAIPLNSAIAAAYAPARLTADDYPALIQYNQPVDTIAVGTVLAAANLQPGSERYRNVVNFVDAFFTGFQSLLAPGHHPKWREVNIAAELQGWQRFAPAADWLQRNAPAAAAGTPNEQALRAIFTRFIDERQQAAGGPPLSQREKDELFGQFQLWEKNLPR